MKAEFLVTLSVVGVSIHYHGKRSSHASFSSGIYHSTAIHIKGFLADVAHVQYLSTQQGTCDGKVANQLILHLCMHMPICGQHVPVQSETHLLI